MDRATRKATITVGLDDRQLERDLASARRKVRKHGDDIDRTGRRIGGKGKRGKGGFGVIGGAVGGATAAAVGAVGGFLTGTIDDLFDFENGLSRLQIAAGKSNTEMAALRTSILDVSKATGVGQKDILIGTQAYIDLTGDVAGAEKAMSSFARIAQASGASVSDVATATAALRESMGLDPGDIEAVFGGLIQQGKAGAVSLKDLAGELAAVAPRFAKFGGSGVQGIADLGAALQVTRKGFGSASEAATGLEALMGALSMNADKFRAAGVQIFKTGKDGKKTFKSFVDIIDAIGKSRLMKDPTALTKAWGSKEAAQAFDMLVANRGELEKLFQAGLDAGAVQRDLDTRLQSSAGKIELAMNAAKIAIAEAFTPERIEEFAKALAKAAEWFAKIVDFVDRLNLTGTVLGSKGVQEWRKEAAGKLGKFLTHDEAGNPLNREQAQRNIAAAARGEMVGSSKRTLASTYQLSPEERREVAAAAAGPLGLMPSGAEDPWAPGATGSRGAADTGEMHAWAKAIGRELGAVIGALTVKVNVDSNTVAEANANAPLKKGPRPR